MRHIPALITVGLAAMLLFACGESHEEQLQKSRKLRREQHLKDSAALKIAVMPTLDCLPLFLAYDHQLFDTLGLSVRLRLYNAQMDCDTAMARGRVEMMVSDAVRTERLVGQGVKLKYLTATSAHWQLIANRYRRVRELKQLDDKMIAMTRFSATNLLSDLATDSASLKPERVFKIQMNDVDLRLKMLLMNEMDAVVLTEPQASVARHAHNNVLLDTRRLDLQLGVIAYNEKTMAHKTRQQQLSLFAKAYNLACDSLNRHGLGTYRDLLVKYCKLQPQAVDSLGLKADFRHIAQPRPQDLERARQWLKKQ